MTQSESDLSNYTILIVEDDEDSYFLINIMLKKLEVKVLHARNGKEAIEVCKSNKA